MDTLPNDIEALKRMVLEERVAKERERAAKEAALRDLERERAAKLASQEAARVARQAAANTAHANQAAAEQNFPWYGTGLSAAEYAFALCVPHMQMSSHSA